MIRYVLISMFFVVLSACTPKPMLRVNVQIHRDDLTALQILATFMDTNIRAFDCRIYKDPKSVQPDDTCVFEDADDKPWVGELRTEKTPLSFILYGDVSSSALSIMVTGYVDSLEVAEAVTEASLGSGESANLILKSQTETSHTCQRQFPDVVGTGMAQMAQSNVALSLVENEVGGYDVLMSVGGVFYRYQYDRTKTDESCLSEVGTWSGSSLCFVRPDQLVVGNIDDTPENEVIAICQPLPSMGVQMPNPGRVVVLNSNLSETLALHDLDNNARSGHFSSLVLADVRFSRFSAYVLRAKLGMTTAPVLSLDRLTYTGNEREPYPFDSLYEFVNVSPVFSCGQDQVVCTSTISGLPCEAESDSQNVVVVENGCQSCRLKEDFTSPPTCQDSEVRHVISIGTNDKSWTCIPRVECLNGENLGDDLLNAPKLSAPFPPLSYEESGESKMLFSGYPGGWAHWSDSRNESMIDLAMPMKRASLRQPVVIRDDGQHYLVQDEVRLVQDEQRMRQHFVLTRRNITEEFGPESGDDTGNAIAEADIPTPMDLNLVRKQSYVVTTSTSSAYALLGEHVREGMNSQMQGRMEITQVDLFNVVTTSSGGMNFEQMISRIIRDEALTPETSGSMSIRLADIDQSEDDVEILMFHPERGSQIFGYRNEASKLIPLSGFPLALSGRDGLFNGTMAVVIADLDQDGRIEIIVGDGGALRIFSLGGKSYNSQALPWPMERRDRRNSGYYTSPADPLSAN